MICSKEEDVVRCLQQAARSATPVTLDLNQLTLAQPAHLDALRKLCTSAASHVTLSNGTVIVLEGVLSIICSRLSFKGIEFVRLIADTSPPPPRAFGAASDVPIDHHDPAGGMLCMSGDSTHVTLEDCTLRMEGDPRYNIYPAVTVSGPGAQLRMDRCKLLHVHPALTVKCGAQAELHDCRMDAIFGTQQQMLVIGNGSQLSLHGCVLMEEEGTCLPHATSLQRNTPGSICAQQGGSLTFVNTRVRMPLGAQLKIDLYTISCDNSHITATDSTFEGSFIGINEPTPGCCFTRCSFSSFRCASTKCVMQAVLLYTGVTGVVLEDCTFTNAPDRTAVLIRQRSPGPPPLGSQPLIRIKGCEISNCLLGVLVQPTVEHPQATPQWHVTVEVEDTTIEVTPSRDMPDGHQMCLYLGGPDVRANVHRCTMKATGGRVRTVAVSQGAHLVMTDCTVTLHGMGRALVLGLQGGGPAGAVLIERTTITADIPAEFASVVSFDGTPTVLTMFGGAAKLVDCKIQGSVSHCGMLTQGTGKVELVRSEIAVGGPMHILWMVADPKGSVILKDSSVGECSKLAQALEGAWYLLDNTPYPVLMDQEPAHTQPQGTRLIIFVGGEPNSTYRMLMTYVAERGTAGGQGSENTAAVGSGSAAGGRATIGGTGSSAAGSRAAEVRSAAGGGAGSIAAGSKNSAAGGSEPGGGAGSGPKGPLVAPGGFWWPYRCTRCGVSERGWRARKGNRARVLPWCQGCTCVRYCSRECQTCDWSDHKPFCQYIAQHYCG